MTAPELPLVTSSPEGTAFLLHPITTAAAAIARAGHADVDRDRQHCGDRAAGSRP